MITFFSQFISHRPEKARYTYLLTAGGTILGTRLALKHGLACNTGGGTHHAFPEFGSGYCLLNDLAIAARYTLSKRLASQVLIVDLDVHQVGKGACLRIIK